MQSSAITSNSTVNNPIEGVAQWRAGKFKPLVRVDPRSSTITTRSRAIWRGTRPDLQIGGPQCRICDAAWLLHAARRDSRSGDYYVDLFKKVRETPEWKKFMSDGAFNQTFMTGKISGLGGQRGKAASGFDEVRRLPRPKRTSKTELTRPVAWRASYPSRAVAR